MIINSIVFLNFIIAILADTYSNLNSSSLGLYYDGIISRIPVYEDDSRYGGLILGTPPFNLMALLMIPFYLFVKNERVLIRVNDIFTKVIFAPIALLITVIFMAINALLLPFAYFVAILKKIKLLRNQRKPNFRLIEGASPQTCLDLTVFILLGLPILLLNQFKDAYHFLMLIYRDDVKEFGFESKKDYILSERQFEIVEQFILELIKI